MKSVNYSFNGLLLVDFVLPWHFKMEASLSTGPIGAEHRGTNPGGRQIMHYIQPSAGHLINCLFIWQIPRRSTGEDRKRYLTVAKASWKRPSRLRVWVRICLRTHSECIVCQWHACLLRCWKHRGLAVALASTLQWMPDFIYYFDGQRKLPADSHVLPELLWPYFLILLCPFVVLLSYYMQEVWTLWQDCQIQWSWEGGEGGGLVVERLWER